MKIPYSLPQGGGINQSKETAAQKEVSRLLTDIAIAGATTYSTTPDRNSGSTSVNMVIPGLNKLGYDANKIYLGSGGGSSVLIKEEIQNYHRPVLYSAQSDAGGHIWVVDAILTQERWKYNTFFRDGGEDNGKTGLERYRVQGNLNHCNWGWYGSSNGWYYNFTPPHNGNFINFYTNKYLYTGINPR